MVENRTYRVVVSKIPAGGVITVHSRVTNSVLHSSVVLPEHWEHAVLLLRRYFTLRLVKIIHAEWLETQKGVVEPVTELITELPDEDPLADDEVD